MIKTSMQLKAKVKNLSGGDNDRARILLRNYIMERFLERVSLSPYRDNFILKGGMLVASVVGLDVRATMDIDTTVKSIPLTEEDARRIIGEIIKIDIPDGVAFEIKKASSIMEEHDYPGLRFMLEATMDKMRQPLKIDISTGDVITPRAIEYSYKLMFEDRTISVWTYNLETLLGEKLETIMARGIANTRMRDFYDIYILTEREKIDTELLKKAFLATSRKRSTENQIPQFDEILQNVQNNAEMERMWEKYRSDNYFVENLSWGDVNRRVKELKEAME